MGRSSRLLLYTALSLVVDDANGVFSTKLLEDASKVYQKPVVRIVGGHEARDERYTFAQVSLLIQENDDHQCGGSLVAPDMVLTAAHCMGHFDVIHFDRHNFVNIFDDYEILYPTDTIVHPNYRTSTFEYDIALVQLDHSVENAVPVRLNDDNTRQIPSGGTMTVFGWGAVNSDFDNPVYPSTMQAANVNYIPNNACESLQVNGKAMYRGEIYDSMMCAGSSGVDACSGDSGGPLILEGGAEGLDVQVGLVSWGRGCAVAPGVYARISSAYPWIRSKVCYTSRDPPRYLQCRTDERNPMYTATNSPTVVPQSRSTNRPTPRPTSRPTWTPTTSTPTQSPSLRPAITGTQRMVEFVIAKVTLQLDQRSSDVGWFLSQNGKKVIDRPIGFYKTPNERVEQQVRLIRGATYYLVVFDREQDGICCGQGELGWYQVTVKDTNSDSIATLIEGRGEFEEQVRHSFVAEYTPPLPESNRTATSTFADDPIRNIIDADSPPSASRAGVIPYFLITSCSVALWSWM